MARRHTHSAFSALSRGDKDSTREAAMTLANAGLEKPKWMIHAEDAWGKQGGGGAPNDPTPGSPGEGLPPGRAGHRGEPGAPAGTQNGEGHGTSPGDGVELMAQAIVNQTTVVNNQNAKKRVRLPGV